MRVRGKTKPATAQTEQPKRDDIVTRDMPLLLASPKSFDPKTREAEAVVSTGSAVRRRDFDGEYDEVLDMKPTSVRLSRFNNGAQLLDSHNWYGGIDSVLGAVVPGSARIEGGKLLARIKLSRSEKGQRIANDLADGIPVLLSAGYKVYRVDTDTNTSPPQRRVMDWEPLELSCVTISAEEVGAGFRAHPHVNNGSSSMKYLKRRAGETDDAYLVRVAKFLSSKHTVAGETAAQLQARSMDYVKRADGGEYKDNGEEADEEDDAAAKKKKEEEQRAADLAAAQTRGASSAPGSSSTDAVDTARRMFADMHDIGQRSGMTVDLIAAGVRECKTVEEFRARAFDFLVSKQAKVGETSGAHDAGVDGNGGGNGGHMRVETGDNPMNARADAMSEALIHRILASNRVPGIATEAQKAWAQTRGLSDVVGRAFAVMDGRDKPVNAQARNYLGMSMVEMAAECIGFKGRGLITQQRAADILTRAFNTTSDFPAIFENTMNKVLLARYQIAMPTYREISVQRNFKDFRPHNMVRAGDFPMLQPVTEAGELRHGSSGDSKETVSVAAYGIIISITRQMMVNDDLSGIDQILGSSADSVLSFENTKFYTMFNANPTLATDSLAVFAYGAITIPPTAAVGHNNYADTHAHGGGAPSVPTISDGREALRGMKSSSGIFINVPPSIILTGPQQETAADQMVASISPVLSSAVNPFSGKLRSVSDANITGLDWYMLADPQKVPCFVYGFLEGNTGPRVRTDEPFGVQGLRVSLEHDFGCGAIDYRGAYRNGGAES